LVSATKGGVGCFTAAVRADVTGGREPRAGAPIVIVAFGDGATVVVVTALLSRTGSAAFGEPAPPEHAPTTIADVAVAMPSANQRNPLR